MLLVVVQLVFAATHALAGPDSIIFRSAGDEIICSSPGRECRIDRVEDFAGGAAKLIHGRILIRHKKVMPHDSGVETISFLSSCKGGYEESACKNLMWGESGAYRLDQIDVDKDGFPELVLSGAAGAHASFVEIFRLNPEKGLVTAFKRFSNTPTLELTQEGGEYYILHESSSYDPDYRSGSRHLVKTKVNI